MRHVCLLVVWLTLALPVHAATYYVDDTGGDNGRSCATASVITTPKATVVNGITCLSAGDTLFVRAGTYDEGISTSASGTSWTNKVRIAAYPGSAPYEAVWLTPLSVGTSAGGIGAVIWLDGAFSYIEFDGINVDAETGDMQSIPIWVSTNNSNDPHHIRYQNAELIANTGVGGTAIQLGAHTLIGATGANEIINVTIHGGGAPGLCGFACASYGVYLAGPGNLVENCDIYDTSGTFIQLYNAAGDPPDNNIVRNNYMHDLTRAGHLDQVYGVINSGGDNNQIYNNVITGINVGNVNANNVALVTSGDSNKIWNNTIYNNTNTGVTVDAAATNTVLTNNIIYLSTGTNLINSGTGTTQTTNLVGTDPLFVNAAGGNYKIQSGSPARDAGTTVATVTTDIDDIPRPQGVAYDIGAYEFFGGVTPGPSRIRVVSR